MENKNTNTKTYNVLAYIGILWLVGLLTEDGKKDPSVRFNVNQGIALTICYVAVSLINIIPIIGQIIWILAWIALAVFNIMGLVNAIKGVDKELPLIGKIKILK